MSGVKVSHGCLPAGNDAVLFVEPADLARQFHCSLVNCMLMVSEMALGLVSRLEV